MRFLTLFIGLWLGASSLISGDDWNVDRLLARHLEAIGGTAKLKAVRSLKITGKYVFNGLEYDLAIYKKRPHLARMEIDGLQPYGTAVAKGKRHIQAYDGSQMWVYRQGDTEEPQVLTPEQAGTYITEADFDGPLVNPADKGHRVAYLGEVDIDGTPAHHLKLTLKSGAEEHWYLHGENFTVFKRTAQVGSGERRRDRIWFYMDYRSVAGVLLPFYVEREDSQFVRVHQIQSIEANVDLPESLFQLPQL